ncbi:ClpP-like prohead protease/major capsid protein fusion protein [Stutzerimonas degradans]
MDLQIYDVIDASTAQRVSAALAGRQAVTVHINSPGGSVTDALAIYANLRNHAGRVTAIVEGLCASAATIIMLAADEVVMAEHSLLMVHNPWTVASGDAGHMRKTAEALDKASGEMVALYSERTGLEESRVGALMGAETWFNAYEAVEAGFAHRIEHAGQDKPRLTARSISYLAALINEPEAPALCRQRLLQSRDRQRQQITAILAPFADNAAVARLKESTDLMAYNTDQVRDKLLAALGESTTPVGNPRPYTHAFAGNGNIIRDGMIDALTSRLGITKSQDAANPYRTMSLIDMARASLTERGVGVASIGSKMQLVGAAFTHTTSDFGSVLMSVSEKAMLRGWETSGETFVRWTKKGELTNFHTAHRVGVSGFPSLPKIPEGAEYKYVTCSDRGAPIALATYGGLFSISRQAIINDDLSAFGSLPASLGRAASRTIGDLVYSVLTINANFADGKPLFGVGHGNTEEVVAALSPDALGDLRRMMRLQKDEHGNALNISPAFVIVPAALETAAIQVLHSTSLPGAEFNSGIVNPVSQMGELIVESRLDSAPEAYYYLAAEQGSDTIEVAYLDGVDTPYLEQQEGWTVDGVSFKVRIDAGVAPVDYRGLARAKYGA